MPSKRKKPAVEEEEEPHEVLARKMAAPNLKQPTLHQTLKQPPAAEEEEDDDDDDDELNMGFLNTTTETKDKSRSKFAEIHSTKPAGSGGGSSSSKAKVRLHHAWSVGGRHPWTGLQTSRGQSHGHCACRPGTVQGHSQRLSPGTVPGTDHARPSPTRGRCA